MTSVEHARESLEHVEHAAAHPSDGHARQAALLIGVLAAALALAEMQEKQAQNAYLANHVSVSDTWAFYQAKTIRANVYAEAAVILQSLPDAGSEEAKKRIEAANAEAARLKSEPGREGAKELAERAKSLEEARDHFLHRYHRFELVNGGLQIAIVLASVSVVTRMRSFALVAAVLGGLSALAGLGTAFDAF